VKEVKEVRNVAAFARTRGAHTRVLVNAAMGNANLANAAKAANRETVTEVNRDGSIPTRTIPGFSRSSFLSATLA
jgi:hypothetical protein